MPQEITVCNRLVQINPFCFFKLVIPQKHVLKRMRLLWICTSNKIKSDLNLMLSLKKTSWKKKNLFICLPYYLTENKRFPFKNVQLDCVKIFFFLLCNKMIRPVSNVCKTCIAIALMNRIKKEIACAFAFGKYLLDNMKRTDK